MNGADRDRAAVGNFRLQEGGPVARYNYRPKFISGDQVVAMRDVTATDGQEYHKGTIFRVEAGKEEYFNRSNLANSPVFVSTVRRFREYMRANPWDVMLRSMTPFAVAVCAAALRRCA